MGERLAVKDLFLVLSILIGVAINAQPTGDDGLWQEVFIGSSHLDTGQGVEIFINFIPAGLSPAIVLLKPGDVISLTDIRRFREWCHFRSYCDYCYNEEKFIYVESSWDFYRVNGVPYGLDIISPNDLISQDSVEYVFLSLLPPLTVERVKQIEDCFPKLKVLKLDRSIDESGYLQMMPKLEILDVIGSWSLQNLKEFANIKMLNLQSSDNSDTDLSHLKNLPNLRVLCLTLNQNISDKGLAALQTLQNLQVLGLRYTKVSDEGLQYLANIAGLRELDLSITYVRGPGLEHLAKLKDLHTLHLGSIDNKGYEWLKGFENLRCLSICAVTDKNIDNLKYLKNLYFLEISGEFSDNGLAHLQALSKLRFLRIYGDMITEVGIKNLENFTELRVLELRTHHNKITDEVLAHLSNLSQLMVLDLSRSQITDEGLSHVEKLANLQILNLENTNITDQGLKSLAKLHNLRVLNLGSTKITDAGLEHLAQLTRLKELYLTNTHMTEKLFTLLTNLRELKLLSVYMAGVDYRAKARKKNRALLPSCKIEYEKGERYRFPYGEEDYY